jgi:hypothetical protein
MQAAALEAIVDRDKLILWLSKTYNDNDPTFPFYGLDGELLQENVTLYRTWCLVVRGVDSETVDRYIENLLKP